jgi:hypothetical protein
MGTPSYMQSIVGRNVVMRRIPVYTTVLGFICSLTHVLIGMSSSHVVL